MATRHRLTTHFVIEEFDSHDGRLVPAVLVPGIRLWCELWGEPLRQKFGAVTILSGYRSVAHNTAVGGAPASVHLGKSLLPNRASGSKLRAAAGDVQCARGTYADWDDWAHWHRSRTPELQSKGRGGIGSYPLQHFVHLDTWQRRDWVG